MQKANLQEYDLEAVIRLFTPEEGGRKKGGILFKDCRYHVCIGGKNWYAHYVLRDREDLNPGEIARVFITFFSYHRYLVTRLQPDTPFLLRSGPFTVGDSTILSLLHLEKNAALWREQVGPRHDLKVELTLLTPEEGGLETGFPGIFRGYLDIDGEQWSAGFMLEDRDDFNPGEITPDVFVKLSHYRPQDVIVNLHPGQPFLLYQDGRSRPRSSCFRRLAEQERSTDSAASWWEFPSGGTKRARASAGGESVIGGAIRAQTPSVAITGSNDVRGVLSTLRHPSSWEG